MFVLPLVLAAAAAAAPSLTGTFMQRIVDNGNPRTPRTITAGALPPDWTAPAPLPEGVTVLGSVEQPNYQTELYYEPGDAQSAAQAYVAQLRAAGFSEHLGVVGHSGFAGGQFHSNFTAMCRGTQGVTVLVPDTTDLRVVFPAENVIGPCSSQTPPQFNSPAPDLIAPYGTAVIGGGGGGSYGTPGSAMTTFSSATFATTLSAKRLLAAFASQLRKAGWTAEPAFASAQGAAQAFRYGSGDERWTATLVFFATGDPHTLEGRFEAKGTPRSSGAGAIVTQHPAPRLRRSDIPAALQLAQRVAAAGEPEGDRVALYPRRLPPGFNSDVPTPHATLLGSIAAGSAATLYYDVTQAQYDAYVSALRAAGWDAKPSAAPRVAGFVSEQFPVATIFCKPGLPAISATVRANTNDLALRVAGSDAPNVCGASGLAVAIPRQTFAPVPQLHPPAGATMRPGGAGLIGGSNGVTITTSQSLHDVLADFASQLSAAKWTAQAPLVSDALGSQTFLYTDPAGAQWQAVLTVYRSERVRKTYYAFIDATKL